MKIIKTTFNVNYYILSLLIRINLRLIMQLNVVKDTVNTLYHEIF